MELTDLVEYIKEEKLVLWVDDDEYYTRSLKELGLDTEPLALADYVFEHFPTGFGLRSIFTRHETLQRGLSVPIPLVLDREALVRFLNETKGNIDRDVREASLDFENMRISGEVQGRWLDVDGTIAKIPGNINGVGAPPIRAALDGTEPKVTAGDLEGIDPTEPLGSYTTKFNPRKRGRSHNIGHLAAKFKGLMLKPGERLSFNEISGPRTAETGFKPAPEYMLHRIITGYGGGSCQVSTTLYNAALLAGMRIDERYPHSRVVKYIPFGRDATVNYDSKVDFKFTNILKNPVVIWSRSDIKAGWVTFDIFGYPEDRQQIEVTNAYTRIWRDTDKDEYIIDRSLAPGQEVEDDEGTNGIRVQTWRHFIQPDGSRITEELFYDVISPVSRIVRYNPDSSGMKAEAKTSSQQETLQSTGYVEVYF
jgi:vancomycin resistance protein YoaR